MDEPRIRCYNQKTDQVRMIKKSIVDSGNAKAQGYEPQPEPEQLEAVEVNITPSETPKAVKPKAKK
jgi:hypothetical protein